MVGGGAGARGRLLGLVCDCVALSKTPALTEPQGPLQIMQHEGWLEDAACLEGSFSVDYSGIQGPGPLPLASWPANKWDDSSLGPTSEDNEEPGVRPH